MKNNILFLLAAGIFAVYSCGTANRASYAGAEYMNGIYYTPDQETSGFYNRQQNELADLQQETGKALQRPVAGTRAGYDPKTGVETIFIGDTNQVTVNYNPDITYALVDDEESYEARLRKFDSPVYNVTIDFDAGWYDPWFNPWWGTSYGWYRPYGITWGTGWYNPWFDNYYYTWYGPGWGYPWFGWHNPWYGGWYGGWYVGWYDPWYYPHWGPGWHDHWGPGPGHYRGRDIYYGRRTQSGPAYASSGQRNSGSTYRRNPSLNQIRGNQTSGSIRPQTGNNRNNGSSYRRTGTNYNGAIYNNNAIHAGQNGNLGRPNNTARPVQSGSMYRRSSVPNTRNNNTAVNYGNTNPNRNTQNTYNPARNNSSSFYRNNSGSSTRNSSFNAGSSAGRSSGTSTGSRSGGSSYRRR